ncbi:MAG: type IV pilus biogenesis/stability protein PilW [Methylococcaceae bacterium]|nr:type IV pilus biogenesis/stability protein PilW [Methylococcaceae bacterium]
MNIRRIALLSISGLMVACTATKDNKSNYTQPDKVAVERPAKERAQTLTELGLAYYQLEKYIYALEYLDESLALDASNATTYQIIGLINMRQNLPDQAQISFDKALKIEPDNFDILTNYAVFLYGQERYEESLDAFKRVVNAPFYKQKWTAYTYLGLSDLKRGQKGEAEKKFYYALKINKDYAPALLETARIRYGKGDMMSARAFIERYFASAGKTLEGLQLAIKIENALQDRDMTEQYQLELKRAFPYAD